MICSAEDLFTLNSNKFRMVYKVDGNPQLDSRDWRMYSNILKEVFRNLNYDVTMTPLTKTVGKYRHPQYQADDTSMGRW